MKTWIVLPLIVFAIASPSWAQTTAPDAASGYNGEIAGVNVQVRSGPGTNHYVCAKLNAPARVAVVSQKDGWLEILPPEGCFSVIKKDFVRLDADGKSGVVTGDRVWYRSAGEMRKGEKFDNYWDIQKQLNSGDKVQIIGSGGDFYVIVTPRGGTFWVSAQYVKATGGASFVRTPSPSSAPAGETVAGAMEPAEPVRVAETTELRTITPPPTSDAQIALNAAEENLKAEYEKPSEQRDLKGMLAKYQAIDPGSDSYVKAAVQARIEFLAGEVARLQQLQELQEQIRGTISEADKLAKERTSREITIAVAQAKPEFAAKGVLVESSLFTGSAGTPKRFIIQNPNTREISGYAQSAASELDLSRYVGKFVGLAGASRFDRSLGANLIDVQNIAILDGNGELPAPSKPTISAPPPLKPREQKVEPAPQPESPKPAATAPAAKVAEKSPTSKASAPVATKPAPTGLPMAPPASAPATAVERSEYQ